MSEQGAQADPADGAARAAGVAQAGGPGTARSGAATPGGAPASADAGRRERAIRRLSDQVASGVLTLDEFAERISAAERASSEQELDALTTEAQAPEAGAPLKDSPRWLFNVFGGTDQRGRWRLGRRMRIFAFLGGASFDLGAAQPAAPECVITVVALLGGVELTAPAGVTIQMSGVSLLGGKTDERSVGPSLPGSPLIRLRVFAVLGGVKVGERKK